MKFINWIKSIFSKPKPKPTPAPAPQPLPTPQPVTPTGKRWQDLEEGTIPFYQAAWEQMKFDPGFENSILSAANRVRAGKERYEKVAALLGRSVTAKGDVPFWAFLGALHNMEASCSFLGVLHNGEKILGTGKKTRLVPAGRGPFTTWEEAAVDALKMKSYQHLTRWPIAECLYRAERYNGTGYLKGSGKQETSPYLWAQTTINDGKGKYVADGKWDPNANSNGQVGVAAILKQLEILGALQ